jgi:hypothetical protein
LDFALLEFPPDPDEEFLLRDEAEEGRRLDALALLLALLVLPPERADLPFEAVLLEAVDRLRVVPLAFEPFELLEDFFRVLDEPVLAWAMPPLLGIGNPAFARHTP